MDTPATTVDATAVDTPATTVDATAVDTPATTVDATAVDTPATAVDATAVDTPVDITATDPQRERERDLVSEVDRELYGDLVSYRAAYTALRISRWTLSRLVREGRLHSLRIANRYFITRESLTAYVAAIKSAAAQPSPAPEEEDGADAKSPAA